MGALAHTVCARSLSFQRLGSSEMAFSSSRRLTAFSQSKVPPQQRQRLSDRFGGRFDLGSHGGPPRG